MEKIHTGRRLLHVIQRIVWLLGAVLLVTIHRVGEQQPPAHSPWAFWPCADRR